MIEPLLSSVIMPSASRSTPMRGEGPQRAIESESEVASKNSSRSSSSGRSTASSSPSSSSSPPTSSSSSSSSSSASEEMSPPSVPSGPSGGKHSAPTTAKEAASAPPRGLPAQSPPPLPSPSPSQSQPPQSPNLPETVPPPVKEEWAGDEQEEPSSPRGDYKRRTPSSGASDNWTAIGCVGATTMPVLNFLSYFVPFVGESESEGMVLRCRRADLSVIQDADNMLRLLDVYANDPMGIGESLPSSVMSSLVAEMLNLGPSCVVYLAFIDGQPDAIALANAFVGFSTFKAKRLLNIHDFVVVPEYRGLKVGQKLIDFIAADCQARGFCKLTLEVLSGNKTAMGCYERSGFVPYVLQEEAGHALLMQRLL